ncbi:MAG: hypothetical protein ACQEP9_05180 [Bacillota bacterium]
MSVKVIKLIKFIMILILVVVFYQFINLGYDFFNEYSKPLTIDFNPEKINQQLEDLPALESEEQFIVRNNNWTNLKTNHFFGSQQTIKKEEKSRDYQADKRKKEVAQEKVPFVLVATSVLENQSENRAVLDAVQADKTYLVQEGQTIKGYQVIKIKSNKIILKIDQQETFLTIDRRGER